MDTYYIRSRRKNVISIGNKVMSYIKRTISNDEDGKKENCLQVHQTDRCKKR